MWNKRVALIESCLFFLQLKYYMYVLASYYSSGRNFVFYVLMLNTFHYITGVPTMVPSVAVDNNTININGSNITLTLSWGEPFNNLDPIVSYTVLCSGDVTCPPNFTTTDNTTRVILSLT